MKFTLSKSSKSRASYKRAGSMGTVRFLLREFAGDPPTELEVTLPGGSEFAVATSVVKADMPADVAEAARKVAEFRASQKADREARMTPEQKAKRAAKQKEREAAREAKKAAKQDEKPKAPAPPAPPGRRH